MQVLVTGANGFVGINIVKQLLLAGYDVVCTYRSAFDQASRDYLNGFGSSLRIEKLDVTNSFEINKLLDENNITQIIHAAGLTPSETEEKDQPYRIMDINLMGTVRIVTAAIEHNVHRVIYVSSDGIYGAVSSVKEIIGEEYPTEIKNLYGIAKSGSEAFCRRMQNLTGIETCAGRVCATYGPMERPTTSRAHMSAIQIMADAILTRKTLRVRGLEIGRNWTYIDDIACAFVALTEAEKLSYSTYNLSYGAVYTLKEVLDVFSKIESSFKYQVVSENEEADIAYNVNQQRGILDISHLLNDTGYQPVYNLESGIRKYLTWLRSK